MYEGSSEVVFFQESVLLGLAVAAPPGPIGALCINRALRSGFWVGFCGGLGTAMADALFATIAAVGFASFAAALAQIEAPLRFFGGAFMLWFGYKSLIPGPAREKVHSGRTDISGIITVTFLLTIANPITIISFGALFAGLGLAQATDSDDIYFVVAGVFLGSLTWWFVLSGTVVILRERLPSSFTTWTSRLCGVLLIWFGLVALGSLLVER